MTSSVDSHTIPPFYACYLLRSYATSSSARTYIGSTPDPARRKKQHNGLLTQGAHKTKRGRPWETQMLVYGFPSKIAALQFEWAWQKPHMSRHLRTHPNVSETSSSSSQQLQQQHIALPLFTDTPLNQIPIGEDGSKPLACSSVQTSLMVARALLKSEPFAGWGLRLIFFEEYLWSAWNKLQDCHNENITIQADFIKVGLFIDAQQQQQQQTRLRRPLPPLSVAPNPICDFAGVDGEKKNMLNFTEEERLKIKLDPLPSKSKSKSKASGKPTKSPAEGRPAGIWPERLPVTLNVRNMGGTWALLEKAPFPPSSLVERGKKKAQEDTAKSPDLFMNETAKKVNRFHLDDEDVSLFAFRRFNSILESKSLSIEDVVPIGDEDQCSVSGSQKTEGECGICNGKIQLRDHTSYTICPSPFKELRPKPLAKKKSSSNGSLSQYGFGNARKSIGGSITDDTPEKEVNYRHCQSIFHIRCLSECFLEQSNQKGRFLLPTHGFCPNCYPSSNGKHDQLGPHNLNTWNEVIRCTFRRKELILKELKSLEVARLKAAKVAIQQAKKVRKPKAVESNGNAANTVMNTKAVTKKKTKKRSQEQNMRHGDSEDSDANDNQSENIENQVRIENTVPKSIKITHESLLSKLTNAIEGDSTSDKHSKSTLSVPTAGSVKRSIPTTWTPMTARTAPSDRTNILLDSINTVSSNFVNEEEDSLLGSDIDEGLSQKVASKDNRVRRKPTPSILMNPNPVQQEVIDLT